MSAEAATEARGRSADSGFDCRCDSAAGGANNAFTEGYDDCCRFPSTGPDGDGKDGESELIWFG